LSGFTSSALAQSEAVVSSAREIAKEGLSAYDAGRYEEANEKLSRALEVVGVPTLALFTARTNVKLGRFVRASELYLLATRLDPKGTSESVQVQAQRDAEKERAELLPRIPRLTITITGTRREEVEVKLDGQVVPKALLGTAQLVDPGKHEIVAKRGTDEARGEIVLVEREHKTTKLAFQPEEPASPSFASRDAPTSRNEGLSENRENPNHANGSTQRVVGWVSLGLGGASLLLGTGAGVWLLAERSRMQDEGCINNQCYTDQKSDVDSFNKLRTVSTIGLIAGTALTATGVTLLLSVPKEEKSTSTALVFGPGFASVRKVF
jgi:hypothetical protein